MVLFALTVSLQLGVIAPGQVHLVSPDLVATEHFTRREQLDRLTWELRAVDINWSPQAMLITLLGVSFGPSFTLVGGLLLAVGFAAIPALILPAIIVLVVALGGDALMTWGILKGHHEEARNVERRDDLIRQRAQLEHELAAQSGAALLTF